MKIFLILAAVLATVVSYPGTPPARSTGNKEEGVVQYRYETPDGAEREETVLLKRVGGQTVPHILGLVRWTSPEGRPYMLRYEADERGYRVRSERPKRPPPTAQRYPGVPERWPSPPGPDSAHGAPAAPAAPSATTTAPSSATPVAPILPPKPEEEEEPLTPPPGRRPAVTAPAPPAREPHTTPTTAPISPISSMYKSLDLLNIAPAEIEWRRVRH